MSVFVWGTRDAEIVGEGVSGLRSAEERSARFRVLSGCLLVERTHANCMTPAEHAHTLALAAHANRMTLVEHAHASAHGVREPSPTECQNIAQ